MSKYELIVQEQIDRSKIKIAQYTEQELLRFKKVTGNKMLAFEKSQRKLPDYTSVAVQKERKKGANKSYGIIFNFLLNASEPLTITQIAGSLDMSISKVNWNLMRLLEAGLVRKTLIQFRQKNRLERKYVYYV